MELGDFNTLDQFMKVMAVIMRVLWRRLLLWQSKIKCHSKAFTVKKPYTCDPCPKEINHIGTMIYCEYCGKDCCCYKVNLNVIVKLSRERKITVVIIGLKILHSTYNSAYFTGILIIFDKQKVWFSRILFSLALMTSHICKTKKYGFIEYDYINIF